MHGRATVHIAHHGRLRASTLAMLESLEAVRRQKASLSDFLGVVEQAFDVDEIDILRSVALAVDRGRIKRPFDAYHVTAALRRGEPLHTADQELLDSAFPTVPF